MKERKEKKKNGKKEKRVKKTLIGGQALMEGVLMRGRTAEAMAVRTPDGGVALQTRRLPSKGGWYRRVPILRGVVSFVISLVGGMKALFASAKVSGEEDETPGGGAMFFAAFLGVVLAVGLFILLPSFLTSLIERAVKLTPLVSGLIEGGIRILLFIGYLLLVSRMKDIRRTFMYHGAEHRTINCYEKGMEMTVENVQKCSTRHNRCGTTFLFLVVIISILTFALTNWLLSLTGLEIMSNAFIRMGVRLALLPIVAGVSYEVLRFLAWLPDNAFVNILRAPGLALQRLTTYPPDDGMAEVALKSFLAVLEMDENPEIREVKFFEQPFEEVKAELTEKLSAANIDSKEFDYILADILGLKREQLFKVTKLSADDCRKLKTMVARRCDGEPLDYVLGHTEFYGVDIIVKRGVLCPRPETELLVERAVKYADGRPLKMLDLCTGSGCIAAALKNSGADVIASDADDTAIKIARENLDKLGVKVVKSDMLENIEGKFDVIVTNPPYIKSGDMLSLPKEVKCEPKIALDGGEDGLKFYRRIADGLNKSLKDGGALFAEIGYDIGGGVYEIFKDMFESAAVEKDYSGLDRFLICTGYKGGENNQIGEKQE